MKFGINQAISQTITQLSCIQLEIPSSRLWNFWWIKTYTTFNTKILQLILVFHTDILCNRWPLGEELPEKEMSFVTWDHTYYHIFYKNNSNHKPAYNKFTARPVITWKYITYFTFTLVCSVLTHATSSVTVLHSVEICFVTSLLKSNNRHNWYCINERHTAMT